MCYVRVFLLLVLPQAPPPPIYLHICLLYLLQGKAGSRPTVSPENKPNGKTFYKTTALYSSKVSKAGKAKTD